MQSADFVKEKQDQVVNISGFSLSSLYRTTTGYSPQGGVLVKIRFLNVPCRVSFSSWLPAVMRSLWNISCEKIYVFIRPHTIETL